MATMRRQVMPYVLVDTNVLLYAEDRRARAKRQRAREVLNRLTASGLGLLSAQVLAEFVSVSTRKLSPPLSAEEARSVVENYLLAWHILDITGHAVLEAVRGMRDYHLGFFGALI